MAEWFSSDLGQTSRGCVLSLRAELAVKIIAHCALVTGRQDGEDSAGRSKVDAMPSAEVAVRAADIADALVDQFEARGWIRPTTLTPEEDWALAGQLQRIKHHEEYKSVREELMGARQRSE